MASILGIIIVAWLAYAIFQVCLGLAQILWGILIIIWCTLLECALYIWIGIERLWNIAWKR